MLTRGEDRGAVAVEFALVLPLLVLLLTAIIDYGLWFSDSIGLRQGVREAARAAVVNDYSATCGGSSSSSASKTACLVPQRTGALGGSPVTRVYSPDGPSIWEVGDQLIVCSIMKEDGLTGLAPLPGGRFLRSVVTMRVEVRQSNGGSEMPADPSGDSWAWC